MGVCADHHRCLLLLGAMGCGRVGFDIVGVGSDGFDSGGDSASLDVCAAHPTALICDSFEDPALPVWMLESTGTATVARTSTMPHAGSASLASQTTSTYEWAAAVSTPTPSIASGDVYLRAWFHFGNQDIVHADLL